MSTIKRSSAKRELHSINDLKEMPFGQTVPKHSLVLLYWFTKTINIDHSDTITLNFDPNTQFGSHYYGNSEDMFDMLPMGYKYYSVGNLFKDTSHELPDYVRKTTVKDFVRSNSDRIVFSAKMQHSGAYMIQRVYLTQHRGQSNYAPEHTYQLSTELLRQIKQFSSGNSASLWELRDLFHSDISNYWVNTLKNVWGDHLACLGLMLFIVTQEEDNSSSGSLDSFPQSGSARDTHQGYVQISMSEYTNNDNDDRRPPVNQEPCPCSPCKLCFWVLLVALIIVMTIIVVYGLHKFGMPG